MPLPCSGLRENEENKRIIFITAGTKLPGNDIHPSLPGSFIPAGNEPSGHACMHIWRLPRGSKPQLLAAGSLTAVIAIFFGVLVYDRYYQYIHVLIIIINLTFAKIYANVFFRYHYYILWLVILFSLGEDHVKETKRLYGQQPACPSDKTTTA